MNLEREHREFHRVDLEAGWEVPAGYPPGIEQKILSGGLDEENRRGARTRLLRFRPGARTSEQFVHDYWEEVFLVSGDLTVGSGGRRARNLHRSHLRLPPARRLPRPLRVDRRLPAPRIALLHRLTNWRRVRRLLLGVIGTRRLLHHGG